MKIEQSICRWLGRGQGFRSGVKALRSEKKLISNKGKGLWSEKKLVINIKE